MSHWPSLLGFVMQHPSFRLPHTLGRVTLLFNLFPALLGRFKAPPPIFEEPALFGVAGAPDSSRRLEAGGQRASAPPSGRYQEARQVTHSFFFFS